MDYCFNKNIPKSTENRIIIWPRGKTWVNGLSDKYDLKFPSVLSAYLKEDEYKRAIWNINQTAEDFWPCPTCFCIGYCCCLCTLGLSFCCPYICITEAKREIKRKIKHWNETLFIRNGLRIELEFGCSTSWLAIYIEEPPRQSEALLNPE